MNPAFEQPASIASPGGFQPQVAPATLQEQHTPAQSPPSYPATPQFSPAGSNGANVQQTQSYFPQQAHAQTPQQAYKPQQPTNVQYPMQTQLANPNGYQPNQEKMNMRPQVTISGNSQSIPIPCLGASSAPVDCPQCGERRMTAITYHSGNSTHMWALGTFCLTGCLCFIPYLMNATKDVQHRCSNCGRLLATWHKSGTVETHAYA